MCELRIEVHWKADQIVFQRFKLSYKGCKTQREVAQKIGKSLDTDYYFKFLIANVPTIAIQIEI